MPSDHKINILLVWFLCKHMSYLLIKIQRITEEKNAISIYVVDDQTWE